MSTKNKSRMAMYVPRELHLEYAAENKRRGLSIRAALEDQIAKLVRGDLSVTPESVDHTPAKRISDEQWSWLAIYMDRKLHRRLSEWAESNNLTIRQVVMSLMLQDVKG